MRTFLKLTGISLAVLISILLAVVLWYRSASQPQIDGKIVLPALGSTVDIVRDAEGIPHIYAESQPDAYFALGFVHAQDRLWQMEMNRRIVAGRMAEILGPKALGTDRFLRTLGVRRNAEAIYANLDPQTAALLNAYVQGINSYLSSRTGPLPPEFLITGAPAPEPWQPADSIGWQTMMAWDLSANWTQELLRMRLAQRLSLEQINEFMPPYPGDEVVPTRDYTALYRGLAGLTEQLTEVAGLAPPSYVEGMGSNNWVVSGARSTSGKPLLANDPHLSLTAPSIWYLAHLSAPDLNVIGATLPGLPGVVLGRNDRIAWGFTNTASDVQDLYIEQINPDNSQQYRTPQGWADFKLRKEVILVKGEAPVELEVSETRHGPVITGALPIAAKTRLDPEQYAISFAWTALRPDDLTLQAGIKLSQAVNWQEFNQALKDFSTPHQNIVYADVEGNIGFVAPARVPIRQPGNDLQGLAPAPGWDSRYDWEGFIPFDELPRSFNPAGQQIVTANEKIVGPDYPYFLTSEWALPYRAKRIADLLAAQSRHDIGSFAAIQKDHVSLAAQELLPLLRRVAPATQPARQALAALADWNGEMDTGMAEPLIFNTWMREASRRMFSDELGDELMLDYWDQRNTHQPMVAILKNDERHNWCLDQRDSKVVSGKLHCQALMASALDAAVADLERRYGNDQSHWRWGEAHAAHSEHRPFGKVDWLSSLFDLRIPSAGDTYTVNVGRYSLRDETAPFANRHAAGMRALYDLDNLENSVFIQSTGQSGNPLSPLYRNYLTRWSEVKYLPMKTTRRSAETNSLGTLTLAPK